MRIDVRCVGAGLIAALAAGCSTAPDAPPPKPFGVVVISPRGELVTGSTVKVVGYVEGGAASMVQIDTAAAQLGLGGSFEATVPTGPDGLQTRTVTARPRAGGAAVTAEVAWTTDNTAPVVTITAPADLAVATSRDGFRVEGQVTDLSPVLLTADDRAVALDGTRFEFTKMLAEGDNPVTLVARDAAGHVTTRTLVLRRDTEPPLCEFAPIPDKVRTATFELRGSTGEGGCRVFVNGEEAAVEGDIFRHPLQLEPGENTFDVVVRDGAGLQATGAGTVVYEPRQPPSADQIRAFFARQLTAGGGGGWYSGQFAELAEYGRDLWPTLIALTEELVADPNAQPLAQQALEALAQLKVTDAVPFLQRLADSKNPPNLAMTAVWLLDRLGDPERANAQLDEMRRALEDDPQQGPRMWQEIGDAHARMNHYDASRDAYIKAIDAARVLGQTTTRFVGSAWYNLACQHAKLGDIDKALDAFDECQKIGANDLDWAAKDGDLAPLRGKERFLKYLWETGAGTNMAQRALDIANTHPESALLILERARDRLSRDPTLLVFLAVMYQRCGRTDDATKTLDFIVQQVGNLPWGNIAKLRGAEPLLANPRFKELVALAGGGGEGPATPPKEGTPPGPGAPAAGEVDPRLRQLAQQTTAPGRIVVPADAAAGQWVQWAQANGRKLWWGITAVAGPGAWVVEQRKQLADGWVTEAYVVDPQGTVRMAAIAPFTPGGAPADRPVGIQVGQGSVQAPPGGADIGESTETITAAGREWKCTVRTVEIQGRPAKQWVCPDIPFLGLAKLEIEGRVVLQLDAVGTDATPGVVLRKRGDQPKPREGQGDF